MSLDPGTLRDELLYVVVFGPGMGESIVLRAPGERWIVVDALHNAGVTPALELLVAAGARWSAVVLTHPHRDHAHGMDALLRHAGDGPVGCVYTSIAHYGLSEDGDDQAEAETQGAVSAAVNAIESHWADFPDHEWRLESGDARTLGGDLTLVPLWPTKQYLEPFLDDGASPPHPNNISTPLLVTWHDVSILLGADLPTQRWSDLLDHGLVSASTLGGHHVLKVPHHGSSGALHPGWSEGSRSRAWLVAPYRACRLPRMWLGEGGASMLASVDALRLSAPPQPLPPDSSVDGVMLGTELGGLQQQEASSHPSPTADGTRQSWTLVGLESNGEVADLRQGSAGIVLKS